MVLSFCNTYQYLRSEVGCLNYKLKLTLMLNKMYMFFSYLTADAENGEAQSTQVPLLEEGK